MLRIDPDPKFWTPVKVKLPGEEEQVFRARFRVLPFSRTEKVNTAAAAEVRSLLEEALADTADVIDEAGEAVAFGDKLRAVLLDWPHYRGALLVAYVEGIAAARLGN